jgi:hypothetical protein
MEAKQAIDKIIADVASLKREGRKTIPIENLEKYLVSIGENASQSLEMQKLELQRSLAHYDATNKSSLEMFRSVIEAGKEAINSALLMNGGAVVAMLSFLGATVGKTNSSALGLALTVPLMFFGFGVFAAGVAFAGRYITQFFYERDSDRVGRCFHLATFASAVAAFGLFGFGVYRAYLAFRIHFTLA